MKLTSFHDIQAEVRHRISTGQWLPGALIPTEQDLAAEFGCARATVNRALRELADNGMLDRRRKAGTRVVLNPVSKSTLVIPIMRHEIEQQGLTYGYELLLRQHVMLPQAICDVWGVPGRAKMLRLQCLHSGDGKPFALEDRWINTSHLPQALAADFARNNANEWLLQNAPFSHGDIALGAANATEAEAIHLGVKTGTALLTMDRRTWDAVSPITTVRLFYAPGYKIHAS